MVIFFKNSILCHGHILEAYLNSTTIKLNKEHKIYPQHVTAISANHFLEHVSSSADLFAAYENANQTVPKILVYDIGLSGPQALYFQNHEHYIYRKFNFDDFPPFTTWLVGMTWKVMVWQMCLTEFQACLWLDASIHMYTTPKAIVDKYIYDRRSSFVFIIKPTGHNTAWATHPVMWAYLPSNITKFNEHGGTMDQSGGEIFYNTEEFKHGIMKWMIACALTSECMAPNYRLTESRVSFGNQKLNPFGDWSPKHADKNSSFDPKTLPWI